MEEQAIGQLLQTVETLKAVKELLADPNPYLPIYGALGGAFIGAVATFIPSTILEWRRTARKRRSTALQIYSEVKASLTVFEHRGYLKHVESIIQEMEQGEYDLANFQVHLPEERYVVYQACLPNLGLLEPKLQILIVEFYQLLEALAQDVKPGGLMNEEHQPIESFKELFMVGSEAISAGRKITKIIEEKYAV